MAKQKWLPRPHRPRNPEIKSFISLMLCDWKPNRPQRAVRPLPSYAYTEQTLWSLCCLNCSQILTPKTCESPSTRYLQQVLIMLRLKGLSITFDYYLTLSFPQQWQALTIVSHKLECTVACMYLFMFMKYSTAPLCVCLWQRGISSRLT